MGTFAKIAILVAGSFTAITAAGASTHGYDDIRPFKTASYDDIRPFKTASYDDIRPFKTAAYDDIRPF